MKVVGHPGQLEEEQVELGHLDLFLPPCFEASSLLTVVGESRYLATETGGGLRLM